MSIGRGQLTGLVLAGGRGVRMGGVDKGLQMLHGEPLTLHVLKRLAPQTGPLLISANRHADRYAELAAPFGATVVSDTLPGFPGPLAGLLAGLRAAQTAMHPVVALLRASLADDLAAFLEAGERKVRAWYARHTAAEVAFADGRAFYNVNSLQELADLERA